MTKIYKYLGILLGLATALAFNACDDDIDPVVEELSFDRVFTPLELDAKINNQTTVTLSWGYNKGIDTYELEISEDELLFTNIIHTATLTPDQIPYVYDLPSGDTQYSVRVKGISSTTNESKWATLAFKSLPENLFLNYDMVMNALGDITVSWTPGKAVTSMVLITEDGETSYDISAEEMALGSKQISGLTNDSYTINLMNDTKVRGFQDYVLEGNILLDEGADLATAIANATAGDVIVLKSGVTYGFVGDLTIDKSLKIKGLDGGELPVIYTTSGDRMFYIGDNLTPTDSLVFENLYMSGFVNYDAGQGQIRGVFDMETSYACNIGSVKFLGCKMFDMGRQIMRLRGGLDQTIGEFVIDDCIIHNLGNTSGSYGVLCATEPETNVTYVNISNSTIDSLRCHFIRYDEPTSCESIVVENCTFNKVPYSSGRYIMDIRSAVIPSGVEVNNCIFGNTSYSDEPSISGIYYDEDNTALSINNTYATSDFVNSGYSIVELCTGLGMGSADVFADPDNGDFTLTDGSLEVGDPRWW